MNTLLIENGKVTYVWNNGTFEGELTSNHIQTELYVEPDSLVDGDTFIPPSKEEEESVIQKVKQIFGENLQDIDLREQQEFLLFYSLADQGFTPDITKYPLVLSQVQEWITQDKLPNIL